MSGICPTHGPYDGSACPYPHPDDLEETFDKGVARVIMTDEDVTELDQSTYDELETELEFPAAVTLAILWVKEGHQRGRTFPLRHGAVIGRKVGDIILDDPKVSSTHAKVTREGDSFLIWDFGSANGTYVNGKRIRQATMLDENDLVKIGGTVFVVKLLESKKKPNKKSTNTAKKRTGRK